MNRRLFLTASAQGGIGLGLYSFFGYSIFGTSEAFAGVKVYRDLIIDCGVGQTKNFPAEYLIGGGDVVVSGAIDEGVHNHNLRVTAAQINQLLTGQSINLNSETGSDGSGPHGVSISPQGIAEGGNSVEAFESEGADILGIRFGKGDKPYLYVAGKNLKKSSISYCIGKSDCQTSSAKLSKLEYFTQKSGKDIFSSSQRLAIRSGDLIHVFAETNDGSPVKVIAKVSK